MKTLFIADIHLNKNYQQGINALHYYLKEKAKEPIDALYILGDLFEYWLGDDCIDDVATKVAGWLSAFKLETQSPIYFIHGNRDFLLGKKYADQAGMTLLDEEEVINLYGVDTLILHGDTLCTDDLEYLIFRQKVRSHQWQNKIMKIPVWLRKIKAWRMRRYSKKANKEKSISIMDVNQKSVELLLDKYEVSQMIHGHTHRPDRHQFKINKELKIRFVLGDWHNNINALEVTQKGTEMINIPLNKF